MSDQVAKVAVSSAPYAIDRPYDYLVPQELAGRVLPGVRVSIPFARGNRRAEGIVLSVSDRSERTSLKTIQAVLDDAPILTEEQIKLALFMRERFFCTVYEAVKAILPAGLWFKEDGTRRAKDKTIEIARLLISKEDAEAIAESGRRRAPQRSAILELLSSFEELPVRDLLVHTGASRQSLHALLKQELVETYQREVFRRPEIFQDERLPFPTLSREQKQAFEGLSELADSGRAGCALLFGVTGSGKTSVYVHLIRQQLERGRSCILLVPEIALTPQMLHTFSSYFGDEIAVLHSSLSVGERYDEWKRIRSGSAHVIIGTRSAIFAPVKDLGLIILDEEQEASYKSENAPRYHARDVAKYLCSKASCLLVLGSATPDVESRYYAERGRYSFFSLKERYNDLELPDVRIVDMKRELRRGNTGDISALLRSELERNLELGEQSILFINRRGAHKLISCADCGYTYQCPNCSVSLTYHSANRRLMCHYCGHSRRVDAVCPECGGELRYLGTGTQRVEEELHDLFPGTEILRVDTDSVTPFGSHEPLFERFRTENIPIMVGTQMVTKGLNFKNVTLVGVLAADQSLYSGDYRAGERTFSLITQVIGRSGRGEKPGRAVIQTFTPDNQTILQAAQQDYEAFYASEIELRRLQNAPPLCALFSLTASGAEEERVIRCVRMLRDLLFASTRSLSGVRILGPAPLPVVRVNNRYRYRINISCTESGEVRRILSQTIINCHQDKRFKGVSVFADIDPCD